MDSSPPAINRLDSVGVGASLLCAVHCALMPLLLGLLPVLGLGFLADERVEWLLVAASLTFGATSLLTGLRRHGRKLALLVLSLGVTLLVSGRFVEEAGGPKLPGVGLVVVGGIVVALAHFVNHRLLCAHDHCR